MKDSEILDDLLESHREAKRGMSEPTCVWTEVEDGPWETTCGHAFEIMEGKPSENDMKFCCYCGHALEQVPFVGGGE